MNKNSKNIKVYFQDIRKLTESYLDKTINDKTIKKELKGGKRLRQTLSLLTYKSFTCGKETKKEFERAMQGTVSMELAHTTSLIHDDIIDKDIYRRGKYALYLEKGMSDAVLCGHKMLVLGYQIALEHGKEFAKLFTDTWQNAIAGEIMEINFNDRKKRIWPTSDLYAYYMNINDMKTACLFGSACKLAAMEANIFDKTAEKIEEFGLEIGRAYQLTDDLIDLKRGEFIDSIILPIIEKIENIKLKKVKINKRNLKNKIKKNWKRIEDFYNSKIEEHITNAEKIIKEIDFPNSYYKDLLIQAPRYLIEVKSMEN